MVVSGKSYYFMTSPHLCITILYIPFAVYLPLSDIDEKVVFVSNAEDIPPLELVMGDACWLLFVLLYAIIVTSRDIWNQFLRLELKRARH